MIYLLHLLFYENVSIHFKVVVQINVYEAPGRVCGHIVSGWQMMDITFIINYGTHTEGSY